MFVDENSLLENCRAAPDDDLPRLMLADWLEEHGQADRAEFIRVCCELATNNGDPQRRKALLAREQELLKAGREEWERPLKEALNCEFGLTYDRGLPFGIGLLLEDFIAQGSTIHTIVPTVAGLDLSLNRIGPERAVAFASSPVLRFLSSLTFVGSNIGSEGAIALANSPHLTSLKHLNIGNNLISNDGAAALANSPHLASLTSLYLSENYLADDGVVALANSPFLASLKTLDLSENMFESEGATALANSPHLTSLKHLNIGNNLISNDGAAALANSALLDSLTSLDLSNNDIGPEGAAALANSAYFPADMHLSVQDFSGSFADFPRWERTERLINSATGPGRIGPG